MPNNNYKEQFPQLNDKLILNVDDNDTNRLLISKLMENAGMKTVAVINGAEAIKKLNEGLKPDLILMDLDMPVLNGLQTSEWIRRNFSKSIPIIINSGDVSDLQKWKLSRLGITDYLHKPYSMQDIFSTLSNKVEVMSE